METNKLRILRLIKSVYEVAEKELAEEARDKASEVKVNFYQEGTTWKCFVTCPQCEKQIQLVKTENRNWVVSNFTTHLRTKHAHPSVTQKKKEKKDLAKRASAGSIHQAFKRQKSRDETSEEETHDLDNPGSPPETTVVQIHATDSDSGSDTIQSARDF